MEKVLRQEVRVNVLGLNLGMFVCRLDRPWLDSPFALQGFLIREHQQLKLLQSSCRYVYVDVASGESPDLRFVEHDMTPLFESARALDELNALRRTDWTGEADMRSEMPHATVAMDAVQVHLDRLMEDLRQGRELNLAQLNRGVEAMVDSITRNPAAIGWLREIRRADNYSYHHALACSVWAASFGRHLGLEREDLYEFALAGLLFDVGKSRLPPALLAKEGALDGDERAVVRQHVEIGLDMLRGTPGVTPRILGMVATHHERHDGSGYPAGLAGFRIPMGGRILGLVDTYDALTSVRSHAAALSPHEAVSELYQMRGTLFQSELVEQFIQTCGIYPTGSLVELSDGQVGVVTSVHSLKRLRPSVLLLLDANHQPLPEFVTVDLGQMAGNSALPDQAQGLMIRRGLPAGAFGIDPSELFLD